MDWILIGKIVSLFLVLWYWPVNLTKIFRGHAVGGRGLIIASGSLVAFIGLNGWLS